MLVGNNVQPKPLEGDIISVMETVPEKPCRLVTVIVEVPTIPALTMTLAGLAVTVKSWTV
jgi:hypothetical protein